jgi:hypothetical protein
MKVADDSSTSNTSVKTKEKKQLYNFEYIYNQH